MRRYRFATACVDTRKANREAKEGRRKKAARSKRSLEMRAVDQAHRGIARGEHVVYVPDCVQTTVAGKRVVHFQQQFLGLPVYDGRHAVFFKANGSVARGARVKPLRVPVETRIEPLVSASDAVLFAARYLARDSEGELKISPRRPHVVCQFAPPLRATVLRKRPFEEPLTAHLALLPRRRDVRLAWVVHLILPIPGEEYEVLVSADRPHAPGVLLCRRTTACAADGLVFDFDPNDQRVRRSFPRGRQDYPAFGGTTPAGFPWPWIDADSTSGNNAVCYDGNTSRTFKGAASAAGTSYDPADPNGTDQRLLNAFYVCNFLHDFFYLLGFDEAAGNFQQRNFTALGKEDDRLKIRVHDTTDVSGSANLRSRLDGTSPVMNLGRLLSRHTALDAGVVIHEFVHGVTNRIIGGSAHHDPLRGKEQSEAMGEGYSDYFAITILNYYRRKAAQPELFVFGSWIAQNNATGWRRQAYDGTFQGTYQDLRDGVLADPHDAGQVWCAALLAVNRALAAGGAEADLADETAWRVVMNSLPHCRVGPNGPSFVDGMKAILKSYDELAALGNIPGNTAAQRAAIVAGFTQLGMGPNARSSSGDYADIVPDFGP